ncbi:MAG TPA: formate-dependent phosphoribosylglycinamide formyltransferase [Pseudoclavibacter sp.]|nr:formate-dependent phosphoribosylglycinamide formyltransferase [Pseudoclavibacter sp.]
MSLSLGTPLTSSATSALLLGSGEIGKEIAIELQRLGVETIAVDRYANAPAMQIAHRSHVIPMLDATQLRRVLDEEKPGIIIPEVEAIHTETLAWYEGTHQVRVVPTARATQLTMNREGIRRLAAEELQLPTSAYRFADTPEEYRQAVAQIGLPCVVKPIMSSSGKGQSVLRTSADIESAWIHAQQDARGASGAPIRVIVEAFVPFDRELTLLTVRHSGGTVFVDPIEHIQKDGDYAESWQGEVVPERILARAQEIAERITGALGGWGLFGVELFVVGDQVIFSEVSPRPHDTGLVTLVSQDLSEFALHVRAILGLPVAQPERFPGAAASVPVKAQGTGVPRFSGLEDALSIPTAQLRLFGKPAVDGERRVAVALARGKTVTEARSRAHQIADAITVDLDS